MPSYSPELNPDELLNADLKHNVHASVGPSPAVLERKTSFAVRFRAGFDRAATTLAVRTTVLPSAHSYEATHNCLDGLFAADPELTALVVENDAVLGHVLSDLRHRGRRVPEDVSIIAVGHDTGEDNQPVPLTTVAIPAEELSTLAVDTTIRLLAGETTPHTRLLTPRLIERFSTRSPAQD